MKRVIFKYPIIGMLCEVMMPFGAKALSVHVQHENICIWALVNPDEPLETRIVEVIGTGINIHDADKFLALNDFVGTVQILNGNFIGHVFISK